MEEQLISFEVAKLAKEKGFNEECLETYTDKKTLYLNNSERIPFVNKQLLHNFYSAPTQSLLQKWFREIHNISVIVDKIDSTPNSGYYFNIYSKNVENENSIDGFIKYEDALEAGLLEALKLI